MRKLFKITTTFAFALFLTAGMAFGQNNAEVEQRGGNQNSANVTHQNSGNDARILQVGSDNYAVVNANAGYFTDQDQIGNENVATVETFDKGGGGDIRVTQFQRGNKNNANIDGFGKQTAFQKQVGNRNDADIIGRSARAQENRQKQLGDDNRAYLAFDGNAKEGFARQLQDGNRNRSALRDYRSNSGSDNTTAVTKQFGNENVTVSEMGGHVGLTLRVTQDGISNEVSSTFTMDGSTQRVTQKGNNHSTTISN
jgi:hypothetical protein